MEPHLTRMFKALEDADASESLFWRSEGDDLTFMLLCNDLFYWATSDAETVTPENVEVLEQAVRDLEEIRVAAKAADDKSNDRIATYYTADLFAARVRGMRPQRPFYEKCGPGVSRLFDACGPERNRKDEG